MATSRRWGRHPVIVFDGDCNLCNGLVDFIIRRDRKRIFRFAAVQTAGGEEILKGIDGITIGADSVMLIDGTGAAIKTEAVFRIAAIMGGPWRLLTIFRLFPRRIRDVLYDFIAAHRYHWFGKRDTCPIADDNTRSRFL